MDHCRYCRKEVDPGAKACEDCADYVTAVRVASRIVQDSDVENTFVAASVSAEIVREFLCRSVGGTRARQRPPSLDDLHRLSTQPLV